jgi:sec-independent protein translocase protein TatA
MGGLSIWHWMIVLVVVLLLFGTGKVSNLMGEFGKGIKSFKQNVNDDKSVPDASMAEQPPIVNPGSISAPMQDSVAAKTTVNQG